MFEKKAKNCKILIYVFLSKIWLIINLDYKWHAHISYECCFLINLTNSLLMHFRYMYQFSIILFIMPIIYILLGYIIIWIICLITLTLSVLTYNFKLPRKLFLSVCHIEFKVDIICQTYLYKINILKVFIL